MERKFKQNHIRSEKQEAESWKKKNGFKILVALFLASSFLLPASCWIVFAAADGNHDYPDNSSEGLEMIADRMKALSGSLASIPAPPQLNQTIQIPAGFPGKENNPEGGQETEENKK